MAVLSEFIARNVVIVMLFLTALWLLLTAGFWHAMRFVGPWLWKHAGQGWELWRKTTLSARIKRLPVVGPFSTHTMTALRFLGVHGVISFAVAIAAVAGFVAVADEIGFNESLAMFDESLAAALKTHVTRDVLVAFSIITVLGDRNVLIVIGIAVTLVLLAKDRKVLALAWALATTVGGLLNVVLKNIFERARPLHDHGFVTETSFSFPSGHSSGSMLIYSLLGYLIVRHSPPAWHIPVAVVMSALIIFVGSSRVILQVHFVSDVLAGYASAAAWVALCIAGLEAARWRDARGRRA